MLRFVPPLTFACLTAASVLAPWYVHAQAQATPAAEQHTSGNGMRFVAVPRSPALFGVHEVRLSEWRGFLSASGYKWDYKPHFEQGADHPVVGITLQDARAFCAWLTEEERKAGKLNATQSYRLPTAEEWDAGAGLSAARRAQLTVEEKLAEERRFVWGTDWPPPAGAGNFAAQEIPGSQDDYPFTAPVGKFKPTEQGIHDLAGNVWEWCWNPEARSQRTAILRGGSWAYFRREALSAGYRYEVPVDLRMPTIGFRCVFEDKQRAERVLVALREEDAKERARQREQLLGGEVDPAALAAMRKSLAGGADGTAAVPRLDELTPARADARFTNLLGMEFLPVPGAKALVGLTEVRVQDYETWLRDSGRDWPQKPDFQTTGAHPAAGVTWNDAQAFCAWLTERDQSARLLPPGAKYRLPTDREWSTAVGLPEEPGADPAQRDGQIKNHFPWSAAGSFPPPALSVNLDNTRMTDYTDSHAYTAPVSAELPAESGIIGLGGNVAEWCMDPWPDAPNERVVRGGSWQTFEPERLLSSVRRHLPADSAQSDVGFRCVLELPAAQ